MNWKSIATRFWLPATFAFGAAFGCGDGSDPARSDTGGTAGVANTGVGGSLANIGGRSQTGGLGFGGAATGGNAGGNGAATGGGADTGGNDGTGGAVSGGSANTGGLPTGGALTTGGESATGGLSATGGIPATGGLQATGGLPATGGAATGGAATGGAATGGAATGGASSVPTCSDNLANQDESDRDCGGAICARCRDGATCAKGSDCRSGWCDALQCASSCTGLAELWSFEDAAGTQCSEPISGHAGTLVGATFTTGKLGGAVQFDGTNYVTVDDAVGLDPKLGDFSVEAWVKIPAGAQGQRRVVAHGSYGAPGFDGFSLMEWCAWGNVPCGGVGFLVGADGNGERFVGTCKAMDDGQFHHYVGVMQRGGSMQLFVDGSPLTSPCYGLSGPSSWGPAGDGDISNIQGLDIDSPCGLCMGGSCENSGACGTFLEPFVGVVDEVALYTRALSASEVQAHVILNAEQAVCTQPTCYDGILNGRELEIDCGPDCVNGCDIGGRCTTADECRTGSCVNGYCSTLIGCDAIHTATPSLASGTYLIDPDAAGAGRPFPVYCDMTQHQGGWTQFAKLSNSAPDSVKGAFTVDRNLSSIASNSPPVAGTFTSFNLARFDAYGRDYTIRIATDTTNLGQQFQYTFYRPAVTQALLPSVAGANWTGADTATKMDYLVMASAAGLTNTTWLPTPVWDLACGNEIVVFGSRLVAYISSGDCLSSAGQTQLCHAPAGALLSGCGLTGTFTAATSQGDGVPHSHGHDATYWIKEMNISGTP